MWRAPLTPLAPLVWLSPAADSQQRVNCISTFRISYSKAEAIKQNGKKRERKKEDRRKGKEEKGKEKRKKRKEEKKKSKLK